MSRAFIFSSVHSEAFSKLPDIHAGVTFTIQA
jgi:hypothetical protein